MKARIARVAANKGSALTSAAARRAEALLELIVRRKARIAEDFFDIGEALRELLDKKLYIALGYRSFAELLEKKHIMSRSQAAKLVSIVRAVPRKQALDLGSERAYALVQYTRATPEPDSVASVLAEGVRTKGRKRPASDVSTRVVAAEAKSLRDAKKKVSPAEHDCKRAARNAQTSLRKLGYKVRVEAVLHARKWIARVELSPADLDALAATVLRAVK